MGAVRLTVGSDQELELAKETVRNLLAAGLDQHQLALALPTTTARAYLHGPAAIIGEVGR